jgi:hypothetical protein
MRKTIIVSELITGMLACDGSLYPQTSCFELILWPFKLVFRPQKATAIDFIDCF